MQEALYDGWVVELTESLPVLVAEAGMCRSQPHHGLSVFGFGLFVATEVFDGDAADRPGDRGEI